MCRHRVMAAAQEMRSIFSSVGGICWTPHSGSDRPAWITQQTAVTPLRRAQKAEGKMVCYKITTSWRAPSLHCVFNKFHDYYILISSPRTATENKQAKPRPGSPKWICKPLSKASRECVCINTKPSISMRANASSLAYWFQSNCVTELSKYVTYEPESRRRLLIKYAKLYLSTEAWICSGVHPSNNTKGGGMFPWYLPSQCNSSFPPLSNYSWLAVCKLKQR